MSNKEIGYYVEESLNMVHKLRSYSKDKKGELAEIVNGAADKIEELSAKILELTGDKK